MFWALDEDDVRARIRELVDAGAQALVVMFINMVLALVLLPLLIYLIKPKFLNSDMSALSESLVAPSQPVTT